MGKKATHKMLMKLITVVNLIIILGSAFSKIQKCYWLLFFATDAVCIFLAQEFCQKAACLMLMKLSTEKSNILEFS
jgi:hypothetical protein